MFHQPKYVEIKPVDYFQYFDSTKMARLNIIYFLIS
jgi:hypothetical protein